MRTKLTILAAAITAISAVTAATCFQFRTTVDDNPALGVIAYHHFFGRITMVTLDSDRDGTANAAAMYRWTEPCTGTTCGHASPYETREDRNRDGRWDTWISHVGSATDSGPLLLRADLDGDGDADWSKEIDELSLGYSQLESLRGY